ncbi:eCIS core domain-containing protein [Nostoc favosum]|uniref:DUF4157 domain-containing protein n=1 Tax=Nostoc favosum CHAB5714 TaxID=2780399 RepID=A0ABS8IKX4_9NOSO|nr:DUF4157 domain-containing protein [Nostoc favosum]MCC5604907.1 DUF4157 domain-containing protein [Nostoc favosum CHAB5714]
MTCKCTAQTNQQQKSEKPQASGILERAAVRSVSEAEVQSTDYQETQPLSNLVFSKDFSRVPISTTTKAQVRTKRIDCPEVLRVNEPLAGQLGEGKKGQGEVKQTMQLRPKSFVFHPLNPIKNPLVPSDFTVQRVKISEGYDTQKEEDIERIRTYLKTMTYQDLMQIRSMLDPTNRLDASHIYFIDYELHKGHMLTEIKEKNREHGGIFTSAAVFINGKLIGKTEPSFQRDSSTQYYMYSDDNNLTNSEKEEEEDSKNDSEVATLEEAYNIIVHNHMQQEESNQTNQTKIHIVVAGTSGPCDGCKKRLERFVNDVLQLVPEGGEVSIESAYLNANITQRRKNKRTQYGYTDENEEKSLYDSSRYYNRKSVVQRRVEEETENQGKKRKQSVEAKESKKGLPKNLKAGIEKLSGMKMDDVLVHYNSAKPALMQALAYTQGKEINVAPGQEKHLGHEAWHVVQQRQGRVKPTKLAKGVGINDEPSLEKEAEEMGAKAVRLVGKWW